MTRIETIRTEVLNAAKEYADAAVRLTDGTRPPDGRLVSAALSLIRAEAITKCVDCGAPLGYDDLRCDRHADEIAEERRYNGRWDSIEDRA